MTAHDPDHYKIGGIETIDFMRAKATRAEFRGYCKLNAIKYISRAGHKEGSTELDDVHKAIKYLVWLAESLTVESDTK